MVQALTLCNKELEGSYAFAILNEDEPTKLYALKKSSPFNLSVSANMKTLWQVIFLPSFLILESTLF